MGGWVLKIPSITTYITSSAVRLLGPLSLRVIPVVVLTARFVGWAVRVSCVVTGVMFSHIQTGFEGVVGG